ncbi:TetR/AcrR family transcriptional regulator [Tessaracoccus caeni]|uniref:TetR/AcrR family transcriptional regulator n=1 Tax=Tessaracoccus caeni TaxID=3031239 RepID=UPI0023DB5E78|nr:TetR family transcriptional regulator [Tessaracoccus caeni]MDF1488585.1 TetR family transcriptional regulator [Tessaracoccus caeni]
MRSPIRVEDLSTKARIRHAALLRFAQEGFGASLRAVGQDAGVSAAAIVKHFGSKEGLRVACDEQVYEEIKLGKFAVFSARRDRPGVEPEDFARIPEFRPLVVYLLRLYQEGGESARRLLDHMTSDMVESLREGVASGLFVPSGDDELRARFLVGAMMGNLLLALHHAEGDEALTSDEFWERVLRQIFLPAMELYADGLFNDRTLLDTYLLYISDPPMEDANHS